MAVKTITAAEQGRAERGKVELVLHQINGKENWKVIRLGADFAEVTNPDGKNVPIPVSKGLAAASELLKKIGWDINAQELERQEKAAAAMAADKARAEAAMQEAHERAAAFHRRELELLKDSLPPGSRLPNGEMVDYVTKPRFYTIADAQAALATVNDCMCNLRALSPVNTKRLHEPMANGEWKYMPYGLCYCIHGNPGDGKHRLATLAEMPEDKLVELYGEPGIWFRVTYNVPPDVLDYTDTGKARDGADVLMQHGYKRYPRELTSALNMLLAYDKGVNWKGWTREAFTHRQRLEALRGPYAALTGKPLDDAERLHRSKMRMVLSSALVFCFLVQREVPEEAFEQFLLPMLTTKGLQGESDPRTSLRDNLLKKVNNPAEARRAIRELGMALKTWNRCVTGTPQQVATFKKTENMPRVIPLNRKRPESPDTEVNE